MATRFSRPILVCYLVLTIPLALTECATDRQLPNIILITLDTTRADRLGCYGYELAFTPTLDHFADSAVVFTNAVTPLPMTLPAHASIMTGLDPLGHGIHSNPGFRLVEPITTLAEVLADRNYTTAAFVSCFVLHAPRGLAQGFQYYDDEGQWSHGRRARGFGRPEKNAREPRYNERLAAQTTARAIAWLDSAATEPLFLWVHYFDPHDPYIPPEPFASSTRGSAYDAEISAMDASLGDLLAALRRRGFYRNAHIIILADHGEGLGDHGEELHGMLLYEECLRIPFLWKTPGALQPRREETLVGIVDLFPTVLDFLDIATPTDRDGISLRRLLGGGSAPERDGLYAETLVPFYSYEWSPLYAWRTARWKYVAAPTAELYDLSADPAEMRNLISAEPETARQLALCLEEYRQQHTAHADTGWAQVIPTAEELERLRSLGYIGLTSERGRTPPAALPDPKEMLRFEVPMEEAQRANNEHRWEDAIRLYEEVLAAVTRYPDAMMGLGVSLVGARRPEKGLVWLQRYLDLRPGRPEAQEPLGDALYSLRRYEEALVAYRRIPDESRAAHKEVRALMALERFPEAVARYEEMGQRFGALPAADVLRDLAQAVCRLQPHGSTRPAAEEAALRTQVEALIALRLHDDAVDLLATARGRQPESVIAPLQELLDSRR